MSNSFRDTARSQGPIVDRMSGRQSDEFALETDLSLEERVDRFREANQEGNRIRALLLSSEMSVDEKAAMREALQILEESEAYHGGRISMKECADAFSSGLIDQETSRSLAQRSQGRDRD